MWRIFRWIGILAGSLSLVLLAAKGFEIGIVAPLKTMLAYYSAWRDVILRPLEPLLETIGKYFDLRPNSFWDDVVVALAALIGALARGTVSNAYGYIARAIWGAVCISMAVLIRVSPPLLAFELLHGIDMGSNTGFVLSTGLPGVAAAAWGVMLFALGNMAGSLVTRSANANRDVMVAGVISFSVAVYTALAFGAPDWLAAPEGPNLEWDAVAVVCYLLFLVIAVLCFLGYGLIAQRRTQAPEQRGWKALANSEPGKIARDLLSIPTAAILFVATNAGLKFVGL